MLNLFYSLRFCLKPCRHQFILTKKISNDVAGQPAQKLAKNNVQSSKQHILFSGAFTADEKERLLRDMSVIDDFLSEEEECSILEEIEPHFKNRRYEFDHWDDAIHGFRETERLHWSARNTRILDRVREIAFPTGKPQLKHVHVLDLSENGYIKPHIDSVKFCGDTITGLSLISSCVMRLVKEADKEKVADVLLDRRSLYIMKDSARYDFTHEVLAKEKSVFGEQPVMRGRRISVICRSDLTRKS